MADGEALTMLIHSSKRLFFRARLIVPRLGTMSFLGILCWGIALSVCCWGLPYIQEQLRIQRVEIAEDRRALEEPMYPVATKPRVNDRDRLQAFYDGLGDINYAEQQIKTIFSLASISGLVLQQAEYRMKAETAGGFSAYRISFPVKGSYSAVRRFCMQLLLAIPFASVDELRFKRTSISNEVIEVNLELTLYLANGRTVPASEGALRSSKDGGS